MKVRKAVEKDLGTLERIFDKARLFMKESGNPAQWIDGYPAPDRIMADIKNGDCYCVVDDAGHVVGTFAFIVGEDPNYKEIRNGSWLNDRPYATIHRLASDGTCRGVADTCFRWCLARQEKIRVDTHADNKILQRFLQKYGFSFCGIIRVANGTERLAFQKEIRS